MVPMEQKYPFTGNNIYLITECPWLHHWFLITMSVIKFPQQAHKQQGKKKIPFFEIVMCSHSYEMTATTVQSMHCCHLLSEMLWQPKIWLHFLWIHSTGNKLHTRPPGLWDHPSNVTWYLPLFCWEFWDIELIFPSLLTLNEIVYTDLWV